jgi:hypothetical protein
LNAKNVKGFVKMISKWVFISVLVLALAVLCTGGSCREIQQETADSAPDPALGSTLPIAGASPASVAGSWSLVLIDAASGRTQSVSVEIGQIDEVIFGRGSTSESGVTFLPVETEPRPAEDEGIESMIWWLREDPEPTAQTTKARYLTIGASGLVSGTSLSLDLILLEENVLYRLNLNAVGNSISGSYLAYDSVGRVRSGSCYGSIRAGYGQSALPLGSKPEVITLGGKRSY